ncbi:MAG: hypothetical protein GF384_03830 [Elusimicrobia bacterium]|nr:hypothetical protein [Elusimicrobiota bacterium]MBD3412033.1 hypothetical protein [Elusimicrobiota bacterium]
MFKKLNYSIQKIFILLLVIAVITMPGYADVLNVPQKYQEENQWCWAGTSQAILEYYGFVYTQTEIAQYGTGGDNTWNWLYGETTSPTRRGIDLILDYFGNITTQPYNYALSQTLVTQEIDADRPFVVRWGWTSGGGHFVVGHGIENSTMYLMDPWSGATIDDYDWVVSGSGHVWTHSLAMTSNPSQITRSETGIAIRGGVQGYIRPANGEKLLVQSNTSSSGTIEVKMYTIDGRLVWEHSTYANTNSTNIEWNCVNNDGSMVASGIYIMFIKGPGIEDIRKIPVIQ